MLRPPFTHDGVQAFPDDPLARPASVEVGASLSEHRIVVPHLVEHIKDALAGEYECTTRASAAIATAAAS